MEAVSERLHLGFGWAGPSEVHRSDRLRLDDSFSIEAEDALCRLFVARHGLLTVAGFSIRAPLWVPKSRVAWRPVGTSGLRTRVAPSRPLG